MAKKAKGKKAAKKKKAVKATRKPAARKAVKRKVDPLNRAQNTSITPMLTVQDISAAVSFYTRAFGFKSRGMMNGPDGRPVHAELRLRDTLLMLGPESLEEGSLSAKTLGNTPTILYVYVNDVDKVFNDAVQAGGQPVMPVADMFWGDRCGIIRDPEGHRWMIATHKAEPTAAQMEKAMRAMAGASGR